MSEKIKLTEAIHLREEMNLVDIPFAMISNRVNTSIHKYRHEWTGPNGEQFYYEIVCNGESGLPTFRCEELYLAILSIVNQKGLNDGKVNCTPYELLKTMGWGTRSDDYKRLLEAADQLFDTCINTNYFYSNETRKRYEIKKRFRILDEICFEIRKDDYPYTKEYNYINLSRILVDSMKNGYTKALNYEMYKSIKGNIAKRLYRYIDKQLRYKKHYCMELNNLTQRILMMKPARSGLLKQRLQPAFAELMKLKNDKGKRLFKIEIKPGKSGGDIIHFTRLTANEKPPPLITHTTSQSKPFDITDDLIIQTDSQNKFYTDSGEKIYVDEHGHELRRELIHD